MNPLNTKNIVAKILQIYACVNAVGGVIIAFMLAENLDGIVAFMVFAIVLVSSFFIYALGEIIELLNEIKTNTKTSNEKVEVVEELPEI